MTDAGSTALRTWYILFFTFTDFLHNRLDLTWFLYIASVRWTITICYYQVCKYNIHALDTQKSWHPWHFPRGAVCHASSPPFGTKLTPDFHAALSHCLIDSAVFGLLSLSLFTALLSTGENLACEVVESDEELSIFARRYVVKKNCPHNVERSL